MWQDGIIRDSNPLCQKHNRFKESEKMSYKKLLRLSYQEPNHGFILKITLFFNFKINMYYYSTFGKM